VSTCAVPGRRTEHGRPLLEPLVIAGGWQDQTMTAIPDSHRDLLDGPVGMLATLGPDDRPQVTAMWFLFDGTDVRLSVNETRQKAKNLMRDPRVTFFVLDPANPYRTLEIRGTADWQYDEDRSLAGALGAKYDADLSKMDGPGERRLAVTLNPVKVNTYG
jgi:PPOX class probable F420-dependent enzyme